MATSFWGCRKSFESYERIFHMKTHSYFHGLALLCAGLLVSCANPRALTKVSVSTSLQTAPASSSASQVFESVNAYRRSQGAKNLERHAGLDRLAQQHCEYLRQNRGTFSLNGKNVSHMGFEGRALVARERYQMQNISENVAAASHARANPGAAITSLWRGSKDHHKNMLDTWTHSGVGVVVDSDGMVFASQLFATVSYSQRALRERFTRF